MSRAANDETGGARELQGTLADHMLRLRPTPEPLAARMVAAADIGEEDTVLEPQAGTGALLAELRKNCATAQLCAVEIEAMFTQVLAQRFPDVRVLRADFLRCTPLQLGRFSRIVMHPPCGDGLDVEHVLHAREFLARGGRLVALCEAAPKRRAALRELARAEGGEWESLAADEYPALGSGTALRFALLTLRG